MSISPSSTNSLNWRTHPATEQPGKAVLGAVIMLLVAAAVWVGFGLWWAIGALVALVLSLNRFYLPTTFELDEHGVSAHYPLKRQRLRWSEVRRFVHDANGGYLSTRARSSWADAYSGMHLMFGSQRDAIIAAIQARLAQVESSNDPAQALHSSMTHNATNTKDLPCR